MRTDKKEQKYDTGYVQMIRNDNVAAGEKSIKGYDTYFMMDYFDLLCHQKLTRGDKVYNKFWNINDRHTQEEWNYKVACKTLSLYKKSDGKEDIFEVQKGMEALSDRPFLGIIQIRFEHRTYQKELNVEETLTACEKEIINCIRENGYEAGKDIDYRIYRSSTSGDFCLVIKSAEIKGVFKIAILLNNLTIRHCGEHFKLNTYTNVGIECPIEESFRESKLKFGDGIIRRNHDCKFALRFTTGNDFARRIYDAANGMGNNRITSEKMGGLFGRYDFLFYLSMTEFAEIYPALCRRKIVGGVIEENEQKNNDPISITGLLKEGILKDEIKIINERVLVPLEDDAFYLRKTDKAQIDSENKDYNENAKKIAGLDVQENNKTFIKDMKAFRRLERIFMEERRTFMNINRELLEVIRTYVPQGIENDSYVNWKILITDLKVVFECINEWNASYDKLEDKIDRKQLREKFFQDLRLDIDAINQFYKFLQNVNAQTWQAPLYEIQTQLDAEKMMIAYREFLYEYFSIYRNYFKGKKPVEERHKFYPLVYPDMSIDRACAMVPFLGEGVGGNGSRLLICRVPSFEYYGRMFDMIPWILHEASHYVRTMEREKRNEFLVKFILQSISEQIMYKLLNKYSNDFGYYDIGVLEKDVLKLITASVIKEFGNYCKERKEKICELESDRLETELLEFLFQIFDQDITNVKTNKGVRDIKSIQAALLRYAGELNLLDKTVFISDKGEVKLIEAVADCEEGADVFFAVLKKIHDSCYKMSFGVEPSEEAWRLLRLESDYFEEVLAQSIESPGVFDEQQKEEQKRDYFFKMRDLHRLCGTWNKSVRKDTGQTIRNHIWSECILPIRREIEDGFKDSKGFVELYRILNMIFGNGDFADWDECERIGDEFNILFREEVYDLTQRNVTIYRETCADLYTAAALGFNAFGYCRQIFQTVSDAGVENGGEWSEAINIRRFRFVMAILAGEEYDEAGGKDKIIWKADAVWISMEKMLNMGKEYCIASLECAQKKIYEMIQKSDRKNVAVQFIFRLLKENIQDIFDLFTHEESVEESLEDSVLRLCLEPERLKKEKSRDIDVEEKKALEDIEDAIRSIQTELGSLRHIMYRIKCFISLLNLVVENGKVVVNKEEYEHFRELYREHRKVCKNMQNKEVYKVISGYYNEPQSALNKTHEMMLEDALDFIQTYYYANRFRLMLNDRNEGIK